MGLLTLPSRAAIAGETQRALGAAQLDWLLSTESADSEPMCLGYFWLLITVLLKNMLHSSETPGMDIL